MPALGNCFARAIDLRFGVPADDYSPEPELAGMLDEAGMALPKWCDLPQLRPLLRLDEELAWQIATYLSLLVGRDQLDASEQRSVVELAVDVAGWIRAAHQQEVRLLLPGPLVDPTDPDSCKIADCLLQGPHTVRDLTRRFHKVSSQLIRAILERMADEGWVRLRSDRRWELAFSRLPDLSAKLSKLRDQIENARNPEKIH